MEENTNKQNEEEKTQTRATPEQPKTTSAASDAKANETRHRSKTGLILSIIGGTICAVLLVYQFLAPHTYKFENITFTSPEELQINKDDKNLSEYQHAQEYLNSDGNLKVLITDESMGDTDLKEFGQLDKKVIIGALKQALDLDKIEVYENNDQLIYIGGSTDDYGYPCYGYAVIDIPNKTGHVFMVATTDNQQSSVDAITSIYKSVKIGDTPLYKEQN